MTQLNHCWDVWGGSAYNTPDALISNTCSYEITTGTSNLNHGLKTVSDFYVQNPSDHTAFSLDHEERYGYDSNLDYLTSASYDGGSTSTTWSYDAAGNRNDASVVDNLNRATTISGVSRTYSWAVEAWKAEPCKGKLDSSFLGMTKRGSCVYLSSRACEGSSLHKARSQRELRAFTCLVC